MKPMEEKWLIANAMRLVNDHVDKVMSVSISPRQAFAFKVKWYIAHRLEAKRLLARGLIREFYFRGDTLVIVPHQTVRYADGRVVVL